MKYSTSNKFVIFIYSFTFFISTVAVVVVGHSTEVSTLDDGYKHWYRKSSRGGNEQRRMKKSKTKPSSDGDKAKKQKSIKQQKYSKRDNDIDDGMTKKQQQQQQQKPKSDKKKGNVPNSGKVKQPKKIRHGKLSQKSKKQKAIFPSSDENNSYKL